MAPEFTTVESILDQLNRTREVIENFMDEVEGDDLPRYSNVDEHLGKLKEASSDAEQALVALQVFRIESPVELEALSAAINDAIPILKDKQGLEDTGALTAALVALKNCEAVIQDFMK